VDNRSPTPSSSLIPAFSGFIHNMDSEVAKGTQLINVSHGYVFSTMPVQIFPDPVRDTHDMNPIIRIQHLSKIFSGAKEVIAVQDVSAEVEKGEIFGLLGPNGAGKTTLIRILTTLMRPTSGHAFVGPFEITEEPEKVRSIIGVCPQTGTLDPELTAWENLDFYGKLLGMEDQDRKKRIPELLMMIGLQNRAHSLVQTFSGGMKRKLEIVRAFIHRPLILFLDEPTIGLDPESRREVWEQVRILKAEGTTIILTTHYMDEAEHLCDRVALMDAGKLIILDTPDNLKKAMPEGDLIEVRTDGITEDLLKGIGSLSQVLDVEERGNQVRISARDGSGTLPEIISVFEKNGKKIAAISIHSPSLEDVFIYFTGRRLSESSEGVTSPGGKQR
jgi:ABC-2 type transport system ATP-binding protein